MSTLDTSTSNKISQLQSYISGDRNMFVFLEGLVSDEDIDKVLRNNAPLREGVNIYKGDITIKITYQEIEIYSMQDKISPGQPAEKGRYPGTLLVRADDPRLQAHTLMTVFKQVRVVVNQHAMRFGLVL